MFSGNCHLFCFNHFPLENYSDCQELLWIRATNRSIRQTHQPRVRTPALWFSCIFCTHFWMNNHTGLKNWADCSQLITAFSKADTGKNFYPATSCYTVYDVLCLKHFGDFKVPSRVYIRTQMTSCTNTFGKLIPLPIWRTGKNVSKRRMIAHVVRLVRKADSQIMLGGGKLGILWWLYGWFSINICSTDK